MEEYLSQDTDGLKHVIIRYHIEVLYHAIHYWIGFSIIIAVHRCENTADASACFFVTPPLLEWSGKATHKTAGPEHSMEKSLHSCHADSLLFSVWPVISSWGAAVCVGRWWVLGYRATVVFPTLCAAPVVFPAHVFPLRLSDLTESWCRTYEILGRDMVLRGQQIEIPHCFYIWVWIFRSFFNAQWIIACGGMLKRLVKYFPSGLFAFPAESTKKTFKLEFLPASNLSVRGFCDLVNTSSGCSFNSYSIYLCTLNITCHDKLQARLNHFHWAGRSI